jgi:NAD-dependent deacetylase
MKKIVVLTGAGISAESGLKTFRGAGGLWEGHKVQDVATPEAWARNPEMVLRFYNERRAQARAVEPNEGHRALVRLEQQFEVHIITQNVDDLHERAGSTQVMHLHGALNQVRSVTNPQLITHCEGDIHLGDLAEDGGQLRPHIVWFGEQVPMIEPAAELASVADIFIIVGTSLAVYPAAGLLDYVPPTADVYLIDPNYPDTYFSRKVHFIEAPGSTGVPVLADHLMGEAQ